MNWVVYLLQVNLALMACVILYHAAFKGLTFFRWNRFYLLGSIVLSFLLPLLKLHFGDSAAAAAEISGIDWEYVDHMISIPLDVPASSMHISLTSLLLILYLLVSFVFLVLSIYRTSLLIQAVSDARRVSDGKFKVYVQEGRKGSFTLFRRIYLNRDSYEQRATPVLKHEMVHATQLHSLDLLVLELVRILLWFNPFVFILLRYVRDNHEFLADEIASDRRSSLVDYLSCLKAETIRQYSPAITSSFARSTIKKRIIMLTNNRSNKLYKWRYLGILPLVAIMILLLHTPTETTFAGPALKLEGLFLTAGNETGTVPSVFPLPEAYKEKVTWGFSEEAVHPISKELTVHNGVDIAAPIGTPVYATGGGTVSKAEELDGWGLLIIIEHAEGYSSRYGHLDSFKVKAGDQVSKSQIIGYVGNTGRSTGPHLHYEVQKEGKALNPANYY